MVTVTLATQRIREVHFVNHIDKSGQIQLSSSFNFHVDYAADNTRCVAKLYQSAQMKDDPDKLFYLRRDCGHLQSAGRHRRGHQAGGPCPVL